MCHYTFAIRSYAEPPGWFELDGEKLYVDTAPSDRAVKHDQSGHAHFDGDGPEAEEPARWKLRRWSRNWQLAARERPRRTSLRHCAEHGAERDVTTSSGTAVAVVRAAELSLRTLGDLETDEFLSVPALEEFTTLLGARRSVSTIYNTLEMAKQVSFLRERDVDPMSNRFLGDPQEWKNKRRELGKFVLLNDHHRFKYRPEKVRAWLRTDRPVVARVDPRKLLDPRSGKRLEFDDRHLREITHHAVVITDADGGIFSVRTGWRSRPMLAMPHDAPSEAWGLLFPEEDEELK
jgi:hypothetical protein